MITTGSKKSVIYSGLVDLAKFYGKDSINQDRLIAYTEMLDRYENQDIFIAFRSIPLECKYFPSLSEIVEKIEGKKDIAEDANVLANKIIECISMFGSYQVKELKDYLGDDFYIVERFGWSELCRITNDDLPTVRAQLRDLAKAYLNKRKNTGVEKFYELDSSSSTSVDRISSSNNLHRLDITV